MRWSSLLRVSLVLLLAFGSALPGREPTLKEAQADFEKADKELNAAWAFAQSKLTPGEFAALREDQRAWLQHRDRQAGAPDPSDGPGAAKTADYYTTAASLSRDRARWLRSFAESEVSTLNGRWSDGVGGTLLVVERDGKLYFSFDVVRGPTSHLGGVAGVATWNDPIGWWSDRGLDKSRTDETNLAFRLRNRRLEVAGANTGFYHGARAYFDGDYIRLGPLTPKESAELVKEATSGGSR